jgi:hypothetical protein
MSTTTFTDTHPTARAERRSDERERPRSDSPSDNGFIVKIVASVFAVVVTVAIIAPLGWAPLAGRVRSIGNDDGWDRPT